MVLQENKWYVQKHKISQRWEYVLPTLLTDQFFKNIRESCILPNVHEMENTASQISSSRAYF